MSFVHNNPLYKKRSLSLPIKSWKQFDLNIAYQLVQVQGSLSPRVGWSKPSFGEPCQNALIFSIEVAKVGCGCKL